MSFLLRRIPRLVGRRPRLTTVGLAAAVLVDVTLVRLLMAPAALTLLGDRLWPDRRGRHAARRVGRVQESAS